MHSRFKKGRCGNPKGRPKGAKSAATVARDLLKTKMKVKIDGQVKTLTTLEVSLQQQAKKAMNGDAKALQFLLGHLPREAGPGSGEANALTAMAPASLDSTERVMLAHHQRSLLSARGLDEPLIAIILDTMGLGEDDGEGRR